MIRHRDILTGLSVFSMLSAFCCADDDSLRTQNDSADVHDSKSAKPKSLLFGTYPDSAYPTQMDADSGAKAPGRDTLELPAISAKPSDQDSLSKDFKKYWARVEKEEGIDKLREQLRSRDIDHSWFPHWYLFDSTVIVMLPFRIIFRSKK